jgi:hypothetical protein
MNRYFVDVNSSNRISGTNDGVFTYGINIPQDGSRFNRVCVTDVTLPKTYYMIQANYNTFLLTELGVSTTITIPPGNYNYLAFSAVVQALLIAGSVTLGNNWTYAMTYPNTRTQANNGLWTWTVTGNSGQPSFTFQNAGLYKQFGFDKNTTVTFTNNTLISENVILLQASSTLYIKSNIISTSDGVLQKVNSGNVPDLGVITYTCVAPKRNSKLFNPQSGGSYSFEIVNSDNIAVDFNGTATHISLLFWYEDPMESMVIQKLDSFMKLAGNYYAQHLQEPQK